MQKYFPTFTAKLIYDYVSEIHSVTCNNNKNWTLKTNINVRAAFS